MLVYLVQGLTLGFSAAVSPGPFQAYLVSQTLKNGWRRTLPAALAPLLSDGPIIALVLLVLTRMPAGFLKVVQILGGFFILYLARGAYRAFRTADFAGQIREETARQSLLEATLVNAFNPNPYIFWSVVGGPILLEGWRQSAGLGMSFMVGMYGTLIGGFAGFIILFATARRFAPRLGRILSGISVVVLVMFGFYQLWLGVSG